MKLVFFSVFPLEYFGGLEKYFIEVSTELKKRYNQQIDEICIINLSDIFYKNLCKFISLSFFYRIKPIYREKSDNIKKKLNNVKWEKISFKNLKKTLQKFDIIYTKNEVLELFILKIIKLNSSIGVISGVHTSPNYPNDKSFFNKFRNYIYNSKFYKYLSSNIDCFHVINSNDERFLQKKFPKKNIVKIYNPFNFLGYREQSNKETCDINLNKNKFNIIWVGRLTNQKGVSDLIKIIEKINKENSNRIIWNIIGDGELKNDIELIKNKYNNVNYYGYIEQNLIPFILKQADIFISTSKWEGFPYNILEAQSLSLPVLAYDINGINDIIENKKNGFLVENINDFENILNDTINNKIKLNVNDIFSFINNKFNKENIYKNIFNLITSTYERTKNRRTNNKS